MTGGVFDDVFGTGVHARPASLQTHSPRPRIEVVVEPPAITEVQLLVPETELDGKKGVTESESGPERMGFVHSLASIISSFGFPLGDDDEHRRGWTMSSSSTSCFGREADTVHISFNDSRLCSGSLSGNSGDSSSLGRISCYDGPLSKTSSANPLDTLEEKSFISKSPEGTSDKVPLMSGLLTQAEVQVRENERQVDPTFLEPDFTTVMLCDLPCRVTQTVLLGEVEAMGFGADYDFLYVPMRKDSGLGYAFVNLLTPPLAKAFQKAFQNYQFSGIQSNKICVVKPARLQGFKANMEQFGAKEGNRCKGKHCAVQAVIKVKAHNFPQIAESD